MRGGREGEVPGGGDGGGEGDGFSGTGPGDGVGDGFSGFGRGVDGGDGSGGITSGGTGGPGVGEGDFGEGVGDGGVYTPTTMRGRRGETSGACERKPPRAGADVTNVSVMGHNNENQKHKNGKIACCTTTHNPPSGANRKINERKRGRVHTGVRNDEQAGPSTGRANK